MKAVVNVWLATQETPTTETDAELKHTINVRRMQNVENLKCALNIKAFSNAFQLAIASDVDHQPYAYQTIISLNANVLQVHMLAIQMIWLKDVNKFHVFITSIVPHRNYVTV
jgi:hypothetical protein